MPTFDQHVTRWQRLLSDESASREDRRTQAQDYFFAHLLEPIAAKLRADRDPHAPSVDLLLSLSGMSPQTTTLVARALRPKRVVVIGSEGLDDEFNQIGDALVPHVGHAGLVRRPCEPTDPMDIYRVVKAELANTDPRAACIDITGGKKVMSAAAALAAWQLDLRLCYLDGQFDPVLRQPRIGTQRLLMLDNPTQLFGEHAIDTALAQWGGGAYGPAAERLEALAERLAQPTRARFLAAVSRLYQAWTDLDLAALPERIAAVRRWLGDPNVRALSLPADTLERLRAQADFLQTLADGDEDHLLLSHYVLGKRYTDLGRFDFAALLFYRTIEGCCQAALERTYPGFTCREPDYGLLPVSRDALRSAFGTALSSDAPDLPQRVGYYGALSLLHGLDHPLMERAYVADAKALGYLRRLGDTRNRSVLAHGTRPVDPADARDLGQQAEHFLFAWWGLQHPDDDPRALVEHLAFVTMT